MNTEQKNVFISYSRLDYKREDKTIIPDNAITEIKRVLDNAGITYWIDEEGIYSGDEYVPVIANAIKMCDIFLFISSEASNSSEWTSSEIAAARMYKKKIIPFRLDESTYNDSIILYIAHLDFLDYCKNPKLALSTLEKSIKEYLERIEQEKKKERDLQESQRLQKEVEQKKLITEIELQAEEIENDERDVELKRRRLQQFVQNVENENEKARLLTLIDNKGSMQRKFSELINIQKEKVIGLEREKKALQQEKEQIASELSTCMSELDQTKKRLKTVSRKNILSSRNGVIMPVIMGGAIICIIVVIGILIFAPKNSGNITHDELAAIEDSIRKVVVQKIKDDSVRIAEEKLIELESIELKPVFGPNRYGYIDNNNVVWINFQWKKAGEFSDGLALVVDFNDKCTFIDKTGKEAFPFKWKTAGKFINGLARVQNDSLKWGFINKKGEEVIPCQWKYAGFFREGMACVKNDSLKYGFICNTGDVVAPCKWEKANDFYEGRASVKDYNTHKWGFIDKTGKNVITCKWECVGNFYEDRASVQDYNTHKWGFVDKTGKNVITCKWKYVGNFIDGRAGVEEQSGAEYYIDRYGKQI